MANPSMSVGDIDELELLKLEEVAGLFHMSKRMVEELVYSGELPSHKIRTNRRVSRTDAIAYLRQTRVNS